MIFLQNLHCSTVSTYDRLKRKTISSAEQSIQYCTTVLLLCIAVSTYLSGPIRVWVCAQPSLVYNMQCSLKEQLCKTKKRPKWASNPKVLAKEVDPQQRPQQPRSALAIIRTSARVGIALNDHRKATNGIRKSFSFLGAHSLSLLW